MLKNSLNSTKDRITWLIFIPLILSTFTHLWNPVGFPSFHVDEGTYIRRALHISSGLGLHDQSSKFDHSQDSTSSYDHPYFGPILLASLFKIMDYPHSLNVSPNLESIERLFSVPRIIVGILSVLDTLLIYRICDRRYNSTVALFASLLFAVMPLSWYTRRIVLDSIMLPFILTSILLALEIYLKPKYVQLIVMLSGISLGLAVFTKAVSFSMIPLIAYLIIQGLSTHNIRKLRILVLWGLPVILIPVIWPGHAYLSGDFNQWLDAIYWQALERQEESKELLDTMRGAFRTDPVLIVLGITGIIYSTLKRDYIVVLWAAPLFIFLYTVGWTSHFHLITVIPIFCIGAAKLICDIPNLIRLRKNATIISSMTVFVIVIFGLVSTFYLISTNLSYIQTKSVSYISNAILANDRNSSSGGMNYSNDSSKITVISGPVFSWIWKYAFNNDDSFSHVRDTQPVMTEKVIIVVDYTFRHVVTRTLFENETQVERLGNWYNKTHQVALFREIPAQYTNREYPFAGILSAKTGSLTTEVRTNYKN